MKSIILLFHQAFFLTTLLYGSAVVTQERIRSGGESLDLKRQNSSSIPDGLRHRNIDYREQMRSLITKISRFARRVDKNFIVMSRGGLELLEKVTGNEENATRSVATTYIKSIDGVILQNVFFPPSNGDTDGRETDEIKQKNRMRLANLGKKRGLNIWVMEFAPKIDVAKRSYALAKANDFIPFTIDRSGTLFNTIPPFPSRPMFENSVNVHGLNSVKNYLFMINPSNFDTQDGMVERLGATNFDALVLDVFDNSQKPLTKKNVRRLQLKKIGSRRLVLAIMNISAADTSHYYWKSGWTVGNPRFVYAPSPGMSDRYLTKYWDRAWHDILTGKPDSYVYGIAKQGFDGVLLDGVENYRFFESADR